MSDENRPQVFLNALRFFLRNDQLIMVLLAMIVGAAVGGGAILFRELIAEIQTLAFGFGSERVYSLALMLPGWRIVVVPMVGGLLIGLFIHFVMPRRAPEGVADVIGAAALRNARMPLMTGISAAFASAASIGVGASVGREGPVVHLGATLGGVVAEKLNLSRSMALTLLGCGVASGIAASFNAPLAGVLFSLEVVIGHYALSAFAPVVIAGVTGTVISRLYFGDFPAFILPTHVGTSFEQFPVFALMGVAAAIIAILFIRGTLKIGALVEKLPIFPWLRPAIGGLAVGMMALWFPQVLGVGYESVDSALKEFFPLALLLAMLAAKLVATMISLGFGFGGGVFSPSLFIGAMLGGAYGSALQSLFPALEISVAASTLIGMGAVAGAVLGAPISTILIIFELTGNYELTTAVMLAVVVASIITQRVTGTSFFSNQLQDRGIDLSGGRQMHLMRQAHIKSILREDIDTVSPSRSLSVIKEHMARSAHSVLFVTDEDDRYLGSITLKDLSGVLLGQSHDEELSAADIMREDLPVLELEDDLEAAMEGIKATQDTHLGVVESRESMTLIGCIHVRDALERYSQTLIQAHDEERGERW